MRFFFALMLLALAAGPAASVAGPADVPAPARSASLTPDETRQLVALLTRAGETPTRVDDDSLKAALFAYARQEFGLRLRPRAIDRLWGLEPPARDPAVEFEAARASGTLGPWLAAISGTDETHAALQAAARHYRAAAAAPFTPLAAPTPLSEGSDQPAVVALRDRLAAEGTLPPAAQSSVFDAGIKQALSLFQARNGLEADGILGPKTLAALNLPPAARVTQIETNLERLRWLPRDLPADRLQVNIAAAEATLYRQGRPVLTMRIVVGDLRHKTPMFASRIEAVILNPPWNVPSSIAAKEILPKAARDPGYLARNHYRFVDGHLQQRPGPDNSLGQLKFDLPSPYGVYLHDTPGKSAFQKTVRTLSHGCMRLEKPRELAVALLEGQGWTPARLGAAIDTGETQRIALQRPLPLFVTYQTVIVDGTGGVRFTPDVYGWDTKLAAALAGTAHPIAEAAVDTDCSEVTPRPS